MSAAGKPIAVLAQMPKRPGLTFRGITGEPPAAVFRVPKVLPTSQDPRVASENFTADHLAAILTRTGRLVSRMSAHPNEREIVLLPGVLLQPIGTLAVPGLASELVILEEIGDALDGTANTGPIGQLPTGRDELLAHITAVVTFALDGPPVKIHSPGKFTPRTAPTSAHLPTVVGSELTSSVAVDKWLRPRIVHGERLSRPYFRLWDPYPNPVEGDFSLAGGRDKVRLLAEALMGLGWPINAEPTGVSIRTPVGPIGLLATRDAPGDGGPDTYVVSTASEARPVYIGDTFQVAVELIRALADEVGEMVEDHRIQIGCPGQKNDLTYVGGAWRGIHGEARGEEYVHRAAAATRAAIDRVTIYSGGFDLRAFAEAAGHRTWSLSTNDLLCIGDLEVQKYLSVIGADGFAVESTSRGGPRRPEGVFTDLVDAIRYLAMDIGSLWRSEQRMPRLGAATPPAGVVMEGETVRVGERTAKFPASTSGRAKAAEFAGLAELSPAEIAARYAPELVA
ncbi:hypothetical protein [Glycomyces buryatensis]|uniref:Uncharacterized protein n=1 Tax=Glycomyces buryatensis TaxID=2570927 RepID=A0A4S8QQ88_9ACTN|nr:hypothetical protein [Glycomyces buryatensis]THV43589.1 hypothetical protein FAB82_00595 [Glycomyces buryatensis]